MENEIAKAVLDAAFDVHTALGPGLLESVYEVALAYEVQRLGYDVRRQVPVPIIYRDIKFEEGFRADLLVSGLVIDELKSVECLNAVHAKQLLTQLRLSNKRLGLLINFGAARLRDNIRRVANGLPEPSPEL